MKVSVNILTWNTLETTKMALEVLEEDLKNIEHEIIVVDNGSIDGCEDYANIKNETNLGISVGKNQGVKKSRGDYIFMCDGDVVPVPNSINCLMDYMDNTRDCMALGMYPNMFTTTRQDSEQWCSRITRPVPHIATCLFYGIYRRELFDKVMCDESGEFGKQGYGWEDRDFFMQMKKHNITQYVCGINKLDGRYFHRINSSFKNFGNMKHEEYASSSLKRSKYFKKKWAELYA